MLLSDDRSYSFVGCYDNGNVKTPALDRLADEGMKFHRLFTAAPQCVPSRAALMTGRSVRSDRYKFIYNCTPWIPYAPVDSAGGAAWRQIKAAKNAGKLSAGVKETYFTAPRPVNELYDLEDDPSELNNLSGRAELGGVERELRAALAAKMVLDFDYLPLPMLGAVKASATPDTSREGISARR